jgi:Ca-activated chloride channel homolog
MIITGGKILSIGNNTVHIQLCNSIKPSFVITLVVLLTMNLLYAQQPAKFIRKGNNEYNDSKFKDAEINYRKALDKSPQSVKAAYNLGDALYKQGDYEKAASSFSTVAGQKTMSGKNKAAAYHNLGNSLLQNKNYSESIEAYKNALRINPKDDETRYNLAYALTKLQQQQNNKNNKDQNKDQQQKQKQQQQQQKPEDQKQNPQQPPQNRQMNKQDADRMLQALNNNEKKTLDKVKKNKAKAVQVRIEKDW